MRNVECLTDMRKHLILLAFGSYEAVRLWWWGGNCGVVDFGETLQICSIPTFASSLFVGFLVEKASSFSEIFSDNSTLSLPRLAKANSFTTRSRGRIGLAHAHNHET